MQMPKENFHVEELICDDSFQQYCLGTCLENQLLWQDWIRQYPHKNADFEEAKRLVEILSVKQGSRLAQVKALRSGLKQRAFLTEALRLKTNDVAPSNLKNKFPSFYLYTTGIAAMLMVALFLYFFKQGPVVSSLPVHHSGQNFYSGKAVRKTIILVDGTVITLASKSAIHLKKDFNGSKREMWLSGEAFFDVKHDAAHPFIIHTSYNDIKVLGTTFNVKAYANSSDIETTLLRGSVRIDSKKYPGQYIILKPNQKAVTNHSFLNDKGTAIKLYNVSPLKITSGTKTPVDIVWVQNRLEIENEPLSAIVAKLQKWYGIEITIEDESVKNYHYSGIFVNETIMKTLEALQLSYPFQFKVEKNKITINK